jgi:Ser/Thr protein kinase RdoA (MazF antagonist)
MTPPLHAWTWPGPVHALPATSGLINQTWIVHAGGPVGVLQRLNTDIFDPIVHEDIEGVTAWLDTRGVPTPRLVRTREGRLWHDADGAWRVLTWIGDRTVDKLDRPADAREAGRLVARFHRATTDLDWRFRHTRAAFHDTQARMDQLAAAVDAHPRHRLFDAVAPLAAALLESWRTWDAGDPLPTRVVHGDLKISNVRFRGDEAVALIDLDTLGRGTLDAELGDAFRSWCNPASEDAPSAIFDLALFEAAVLGYAEGQPVGTVAVGEAEWAAVVPGVERIALELAARFARDALEESYFGFHPRYGGRGEHNLIRARGQRSLADAVRAARAPAERAVMRARAVIRA